MAWVAETVSPTYPGVGLELVDYLPQRYTHGTYTVDANGKVAVRKGGRW